ncbi:hypothetical protein [Catenovulum agarivorans]|uniref:hypothetical protein n=1 Tax=Catenovulum agarivorans TaxID=1172192 RepID=UPI0002E87DBF|nr:hypothetical protein [Catenovulum agarivorans]
MPRSKTYRQQLPATVLNIDYWPYPMLDNSKYSEEQIAGFIQKVRAVKMYFDDQPLTSIESQTNLNSGFIIKLVQKCLRVDDNGEIYGFCALLPYFRVKKYKRIARTDIKPLVGKGYSGSFTKLLNDYPELNSLLDSLVFRKITKKNLSKASLTNQDIHRKFISKCRDLGLEQGLNYPFNTLSLGYRSMCSHIQSLKRNAVNSNLRQIVGESAKQKLAISDGTGRLAVKVLDSVECDAHLIDAIFCTLLPSPFGGVEPFICKRLWLITIQDICTRAILGYHLSWNAEVTASDVLKAIKHALTPWEKLEGKYLGYSQQAAFPSALSPEYAGLCWKEFKVDGALANICAKTTHKLQRLMEINPKVGVRRNKDDRPFVERLFLTLEERGFHRLPNTTGSSVNDPLRNFPEKAAIKYYIQVDDLQYLVDTLLANYNATEHQSIGMRTPLEYFRFSMESLSELPNKVTSDYSKFLSTQSQEVTVKGNMKLGVRPYINFCYSKYHSDVLRASYKFINKKLIIEFDEDDMRVVSAYSDGQFVGKLKASFPWNNVPHSMTIRKTINSLLKKKKIALSHNINPIEEYLKYIEKTSKGMI